MARKTPIQRKEELEETQEHSNRHQPVSNALKIKIDHLRTFEPLTENQRIFFELYNGGAYCMGLLGSPGVGKAQPLYSKILTEKGWKKMVDIKVGDTIHSKDKLTKVTGIFPQGVKPIYEIEFSDGARTRCSDEHLWECYVPSKISSVGKRSGKTKKQIVDTKFILNFMERKKNSEIHCNLSIDLFEPISTPNISLPLDPYLLGVIIGDCGLTNSNVVLSTADDELIEYLNLRLPSGYGCVKVQSKYEYNIRELDKSQKNNLIKEKIRDIGLDNKKSYDKFIPDIYKISSVDQKIELLQGLLDTDGTVNKRKGSSISFCTTSEKLANDVCEIVRSIGGKCSIKEKETHFTYKGVKKQGHNAFILNISYRFPEKLFKLTRKKQLCSNVYDPNQYRRIIKDIRYIGEEECQCIMVDDESHLYVTDDYILTHNTFLSLYKAFGEVLDKSNSFKQVVVVRSAVQVRDQGYVPGDLEEKMQIYEQPYKEICETLFSRPDAWDRLKEQGYARFISTTAIRGISIDDAIIIVDECQSMSWHELASVITRTGHRSKIIFVGDLKQNDLIKSKHDVSGLKEFLAVLDEMDCFQSVTFTPEDIVRSSLVKSFLIACEKLGY